MTGLCCLWIHLQSFHTVSYNRFELSGIFRPGDAQFAARKADGHVAIQQAALDSNGDSRAGTGTASLGFARAAFVHTQADVAAVVDLHEADVDGGGEKGVNPRALRAGHRPAFS